MLRPSSCGTQDPQPSHDHQKSTPNENGHFVEQIQQPYDMTWSSPSCQPAVESDFGDFQQFNRSPARSPSRLKWSPQVYTIAEDTESISSGLLPTKLFSSNGTLASIAPNPNSTPDQTGMSMAQDDNSPLTQGLLAPSLEPNDKQPKENEEDGIPITLDELLTEIKRLAQHDFTIKGVHYHPVLKGIFQRLCDYDVMLKNARKKVERAVPASPKTSAAISSDSVPPSPYESNRRKQLSQSPHQSQQNSSTGSALNTPQFRRVRVLTSSSAAASVAINPRETPVTYADPINGQAAQHIACLEEKVVDLEQQLAQSRRAHHGLLQDHIVSLKASAPPSDLATQSAVASLKSLNPTIQSILSSVTHISSSPRTDVNSFPPEPDTERSRTVSNSSRLAEQQARLAESMTRSQLSLHDALVQAQQQQVRQLNHLKEASVSAQNSGSEKQLAIDSQAMVNEAVTRLLRAETELGLLKLVMAQNQEEISGLEEEVFQKQKELHHHRRILESMIESNRLGYVTQIQEDRTEIRALESILTKEKRVAAARIAALELEIEKLKTTLVDETKDAMDLDTKKQIQVLESELTQLRAQVKNYAEEVSALEQRLAQIEAESKSDKESLAQTSSRLQQALDHGVEETLDMIDHMEKEHKTKSGALKSNLLKSQRATIRLQNEVAAMALRIVRIQTLNEGLEESAERDQAEIARLTKEVEEHKEEIHKIRSEHVSLSPPSDARTNDQETKELKENMTALEIQLEEVTATLRLKELELEHALKETEKVMLQLEELEAKLERELATQKDGHVEEMARFDQEKRGQAQRERAAQVASVTLFQNMVTRLQAELNDTQEKLRDMTLCWGHTKEQLMKCDASYRRRKKELDETTKALHEVNETVAHLSDAIELLEKEKRSNMVLVQTIAKRDQALANMEYRVKQLEEERL
ncbi:hypothetical protein BGZ59_008471 [Podila verticillata]|nr:hypothetical protein BGZ59_008471 [Podila verticillata]